jgi:iron complex transport system ATP-binding protein
MRVEGLGFAYEGSPPVLRDISFSLDPGRVICILGPNGSGKTTLLHCMARLLEPASGSVRIGGADIAGMSHGEVARNLGFVPQSLIPAFAYEVLDYVVTGCAPRMGLFQKPGPQEFEMATKAIEMMQLTHLMHKSYTNISGGERQQVSIARVIAQQTGIVLMDEPTAHLDYGNQVKVLRIIKTLAANGYAVVITTHNPEHAIMLGDQVVVLGRDGAFSFGNHHDIINGPFLSSLYGIDIQVRHIDQIGRDVCIAHPF